ncbi:Extracellular solute-binding protein family 1 [uncultured Pleomorphomonas sp.]|uniref:ABC transporter substrate-binding protein n=2 Tax=Pleomorphomonas TaxID=261933 RepID=A0A2G9WQF0_9HYPH|nr:extracellular solute-binding protein [Pleomorphomonas carboxyditropha]PIO96532.1 ABC transporter substrate-binding protein [Pleomorphomonas carboxyditropha]SCM75851.1 Extracellular solute-binding protein family 1 [uncultured Pleomorphomonas sp.]
MDRRTFLAGGLGASLVPLMGRFAFAAGKPVTWWYESATPEQQQAIADVLIGGFNAAHPDYSLTIDYRGSEFDKQMRVALLSGTGPDVVYTAGPSYVAPMARAGQLLALDDYAETFGWNKRILPVFLEMGKYDGKLYALPKTYETLGIFFNQTFFDKNGWKAPTTIAELEALADEALKAKLVPFAAGNANWRPANEHYVTIALNSIAGPDNVYKALTGELPWTAEPFVAAISKLNDWWQKGYFGPDYFSLTDEQAFALMANGKAATMPSGTWQFQRIPTYFPPVNSECGFVGFPSADGIGEPVYALGVGSTLSIAAVSQIPDGAAAAIDYVFSPEFYSKMNSVWQGEWNTPLVDLSAVQISNEVPALYAETMKTLADAVADNHYGYTSWTFLPPATDSQLVNGIEEVWLGRSTVADFLAQLDATFQQEKADGKVPAVPAR